MKRENWQAHVDTCNQNKQSKIAYAKQHNLVYSQLLYWARLLSGHSKDCNKPNKSFVPVKVRQPAPRSNALGILEFPGGIKLHIHDVSLLNNLTNLWGDQF